MTEDNKPTIMQAKAMELIRDGVNPVKAMRDAGYSEETSRSPKQNLLGRTGVQSIIEQYKAEYTRVGITPSYMADKTKEWLEAHKIKTSLTEPDQIVPDYQTQLKAAEFVRTDFGLQLGNNDTNQTNILVIPSELIEKYGITSNTKDSSKG